MSLNNPKSGFYNTADFQSAALPWVISGTTIANSVTQYTLPKVTKNILVHNLASSSNKWIRIGFTRNGVNGVEGNYYFIVNSGDIVTLDARVKEIFVRADTFSDTLDYSIYCGLTTIDSNMMPVLTGSVGGAASWDGIG